MRDWAAPAVNTGMLRTYVSECRHHTRIVMSSEQLATIWGFILFAAMQFIAAPCLLGSALSCPDMADL